MGASDQDAVPKSEAFDKNVEKNAEEGAQLLEKTVKRGIIKSSLTEIMSARFGYNNANKRHYRDGGFSIALVVFTAATVCVGIFAAFNHNSDFFRVHSATYDNSSKGCKVPKGFLDAPSSTMSKAGMWASRIPADAKTALYVLLATLILSAPLACSLLWVLRKHPRKMFLTAPFMVIVLLVTVLCAVEDGCIEQLSRNRFACTLVVLPVTFAAFNFSVIRYDWDNMELSIRVIGTASEALYKNLVLLLVLPALRMAFFLYFVPAIFGMFLAYANGKIVLSPVLAAASNRNLEVFCSVSSFLLDESCCVWETDRWVLAYLVLAIFTTLWGVLTLNEIDVFTISRTISQWYFGAAQHSTTVGTANRSVRHALGPSFGTVCFAGLALEPTRSFGRAAGSIRKKGGIVRFVRDMIRKFVLSVLPCLEFMTNFTTHFAAITGEGFCASASMAFDLLKRNFPSNCEFSFVANSSPRRLLTMLAFVLSASYGVCVWGVLNLFVQNGGYRWQISYGAFVLVFSGLFKCFRIVAAVEETLCICYAIDKDNCEVSRRWVYDVYALLSHSLEMQSRSQFIKAGSEA